MKIGIFTSRSTDPMHPRLEAYTLFFTARGIEFDIFPLKSHPIFSRINWLTLHFFDIWSVLANRHNVKYYDVVFIQDLKYLPLARFAKRRGKRVIYETIDNNVHLRQYSLEKKIPFLGRYREPVIKHFTGKERRLAFSYCDEIIVNSKALLEYFDKRAHLMFYYSSFESINTKNNSKNLPALLYLGAFSTEKGASEIIELQKRLNLELFIFGTISNNDLQKVVSENQKIHHTDKISHEELSKKLEFLFNNYFLLGISLIRPVHYSYATQEANKDIDYLSLGIPLIGNHRLPTEEKILAGCGVFIENEDEIRRLLSDKNIRATLSDNCIRYYFNNYSKENFHSELTNLLEI